MENKNTIKQDSFLIRTKSLNLSRISIFCFMLLASIALVNCTPKSSSNGKTNRAESKVKKSQKEYQSDVEKFKSQINDQITQNNVEIEKLKGQFSDDDKANNKKLKREIKVLDKKNIQLKRKLNDYNVAK